MRLFLDFIPEQDSLQRRRLSYAFRLFCAVYGHEPVLDRAQANAAAAWLSYRTPEKTVAGPRTVHLSNLYKPRSPRVSAPAPTRIQTENGETTALIYAPVPGATPDWLGEIFEWVSCADEYSVRERDAVGRVPFRMSYAGRHGLPTGLPYAGIAMRCLQQALWELDLGMTREPVCPVDSIRHFVVNTHDVDFLPLGRVSVGKRLAKNALISLLLQKSFRSALKQARKALAAAVNPLDPTDQIPALAAGEAARSAGASYFFIAARGHRRDANYTLDHPSVLRLLHDLSDTGMEVGVHGSYTSLDEPGRLRREFAVLRGLGFPLAGGRQHWLRFTLDRLIREVEGAGGGYDTSLGWSDQVGFRAGACFAFPPYDFDHERPANFLEIPLVVMDQTLQQSGKNEGERYDSAAQMLAMSRRYGWGGISVLWHPTGFGGDQLSADVGRIFWALLDNRLNWNDTWISGADFAAAIRERYCQAGLLRPQPSAQDQEPLPAVA